MKFKLYLLILSAFLGLNAQIGIQVLENGVNDGYTLIHPQDSENTYLINNEGYIVNTWPGNAISGKSFYLLENGLLLRTMNSNDSYLNGGGVGGVIQLVKWDGSLYWEYRDSFEGIQRQHHDVQYLPNGNILALEWVPISQEVAINNGKDPSFFTDITTEVWSERITEYQITVPGNAEVVWQWNLWEHLVQDFDISKANYGDVSENPSKMNVNFRGSFNPLLPQDWIHANSINYSSELDQILISSPFLHEFYIIDHSTTTEQASTNQGGNANMGGDFLYRWGNPLAYDRGTSLDQKLFGQHAVKWQIENDDIKVLLFNNGGGRPEGNYSTIDVITLPYDPISGGYELSVADPYGPTSGTSRYTAPNPTDFFSRALSNASPLANGNLLICEGLKGKVFEINDQNEIVWTFINPLRVNDELCIQDLEVATAGGLFRAEKYDVGYAGLPLSLSVSNRLYWEENCVVAGIEENLKASIWPNPFNEIINVLGKDSLQGVKLFDLTGKEVLCSQVEEMSNYLLLEASALPPGQYILSLQFHSGEREAHRIVKN